MSVSVRLGAYDSIRLPLKETSWELNEFESSRRRADAEIKQAWVILVSCIVPYAAAVHVRYGSEQGDFGDMDFARRSSFRSRVLESA